MPPRTGSREIGQRAEDQALAHLEAAGLALLTRNFRCRAGEIDLVMQDGGTLVFVEVRYRSHPRFGTGAESVTRVKQTRLIRAARYFVRARSEFANVPARFDVMSISPPNYGPPLNWVKNAFSTST